MRDDLHFFNSPWSLMKWTTGRLRSARIGCVVLVSFAVAIGAGCRDAPDEEVRRPDARPSEWAWMQRTFPHGKFDRDVYKRAYAQTEELSRASKSGLSTVEWELAGPTNIGGRIVDIEFDPLNPDVVYAGAATGGVYKSTDTGNTWTPVFDGFAVAAIGDIGVAPSAPEVVYAGTGEANGLFNNLQGAGIFKSTDAGATWDNVGLEKTAAIGRILVHPTDPDLVYVAAVGSYFDVDPNRGVYRSTNGGVDWEQVFFVSDSTGAIDLVMNPNNPDVLYAAMWHRYRRPTVAELEGPTSGIYKTTDAGETWTELKNGLPDPDSEDVGRIGIAISESQPDILYASYTDGFRFTALYKTTDGGASWTDFNPAETLADNIFTGTFSWFFGQVRVSPTDPDRVYVMEVEFAHTRNGGETWAFSIGGNNLHVDHHALAFHPENSDYVIVGNDGGMNISEDGGLTWRKIRGLPITQFYGIEIDPRFPEQIYGGTQDNQTVYTPTGGLDDWETFDLRGTIGAGGDGFHVEVTYEPVGDHKAIYIESQYGNLYKAFAGDEFRSIFPAIAAGERRNWSAPFVFAPNSVAELYFGAESVFKSETRGSTWSRISPPLTKDWPTAGFFGTITDIDVAPSFADAIIVGTDDSHIWITNNGGGDWTEISDGLPERWVTQVAFDPNDATVAYATFSGLQWRDPVSHVFRTDNFGKSWIDISGNLPDVPVNVLAIDPHNPRVLYIGTDVGAFVHPDQGRSTSQWEVLGAGLPAVAVYDLRVNAEPHFLLAGTHGRSMHKLDLTGMVTANDPTGAPEVPSSLIVDGNYPNPFSASTSIGLRLDRPADLNVSVFDLAGRHVSTLFDGPTGAGVLEVDWDGRKSDGSQAASGTYLYRVETATHGASHTGSMVLVRTAGM